MTHIAIQEKLDGKAVEWMEQVTDEQYKAGANMNRRRCNEQFCAGGKVDRRRLLKLTGAGLGGGTADS